MSETKQEVRLRKIRNGLRKQAVEVERKRQIEKDKVWAILNSTRPAQDHKEIEIDDLFSPYIPLTVVRNDNNMITAIDLETTA